MVYLSYAAFAGLLYVEISPKFNTNTCLRKLAIFAVLVLLVAKGWE